MTPVFSLVFNRGIIGTTFLLYAFISLVSCELRAQSKITGQVVDAYGDLITPKIQKDSVVAFSSEGYFEIRSEMPTEICISHIGYFNLRLKFNKAQGSIDLGKIYMIEDRNWLDGPQNGYIENHYSSGKIQYKSTIRKGMLDGLSEFYDSNGQIVQQIFFKKNRPVKIMMFRGTSLEYLKFNFDEQNHEICIFL